MKLKIALLEPFFSGSHKNFAENLKKFSKHEITLITMKGRFWKWRSYGAALYFADEINNSSQNFDLIIATEIIDVSVLKSRLNKPLSVFTYFHENQLTYPWSPGDHDPQLNRDLHYQFKNFTTALTSDHNFFNSSYHLNSFLKALEKMIKKFPDYTSKTWIDEIKEKSEVLYLGVDLSFEVENQTRDFILWNHRWEYDKNFKDFHKFCERNDSSINSYCIVGTKQDKYPNEFDEFNSNFKDKITQYGAVNSKLDYWSLLQKSSILPVTSNQDFFGISIVEAMAAGVIPLLPNRLSYPEHIPKHLTSLLIYDDEKDLDKKFKQIIKLDEKEKVLLREEISNYVMRYNFKESIKDYDYRFEKYFSQS